MGTRVSFIAGWPSVISPASTCDRPDIHVDWLPTPAEVTHDGHRRTELTMQKSLGQLFRDASCILRHKVIFPHFPGYLGHGPGAWRTTPVSLIEVDDWKLMKYLGDGHFNFTAGSKTSLSSEIFPLRKRQKPENIWLDAGLRESIYARVPIKSRVSSAVVEKMKAKGKRNKRPSK